MDTTDRYLIARLGALCFLFSTIEYMIPKPLPFLRIGLANLPVMLAITLLPLRSFSLLVLIKVLGQALLGGTLFSWLFLFSLAGTLSSAAFMYSLKKLLRSRVSYIGLSVGGAFVSNASQLVLAKYLVFGESARLVAPPFLFMGVITGTILGMFANHFAAKSRWFAAVRDGTLTIGSLPELPAGTSSGKDLIRIPAALVLILILMFSPSLVVTAGITLLSVVLLIVSTIRFRFVPPLLAVTGIVLFNLLVPFGRVLAEPFSLPITEGALLLGIKKPSYSRACCFFRDGACTESVMFRDSAHAPWPTCSLFWKCSPTAGKSWTGNIWWKAWTRLCSNAFEPFGRVLVIGAEI